MEDKARTKPDSRNHRRGFSHPLHTPFRLWLNALPQRPVELLFAATLALLIIGGTLMYFAERSSPGSSVDSWWDAAWLCITSLTENYGDVGPTSTASRLIVVLVAFTGIVLIGSFTGVVTNYMTGETTAEHRRDFDEIKERLERIEALLAQNGKHEKRR